jgi:hypothetical protein
MCPGRINTFEASGAGVVTHSSGLILFFEEPRSVMGVRVSVGTIVTGGRHADILFRYN